VIAVTVLLQWVTADAALLGVWVLAGAWSTHRSLRRDRQHQHQQCRGAYAIPAQREGKHDAHAISVGPSADG